MSLRFPPPETFIKTYAGSELTATANALFTTPTTVGPCTVTRIFYLCRITVGQTSPRPLRLIATYGQPVISAAGVLTNGFILGEWQVTLGQEFQMSAPVPVPYAGVILGTWLVQSAAAAMHQSSRFSFLPWVNDAPPDLRRSTRPRRGERFQFSNVVLPFGGVAIRSTRLISSEYIITAISYRFNASILFRPRLRPFVSVDTDTTVPPGTTASAGSVPGEELLSATRDNTGLVRPGFLGAHNLTQNVRPWKNVRFRPSAIKLLFHAADVAGTFTAAVDVEYLKPAPWWLNPVLKKLAGGR